MDLRELQATLKVADGSRRGLFFENQYIVVSRDERSTSLHAGVTRFAQCYGTLLWQPVVARAEASPG